MSLHHRAILSAVWLLVSGVWPTIGQAQAVEAVGQSTYQEHCASCHGGDAAVFMNRVLERKDDTLLVKKTGASLQAILDTHGAADAAEREKLTSFLRSIVLDRDPR